MSWFVGKNNRTSDGKYLVTHTHSRRSKLESDHIDNLYQDLLTMKQLKLQTANSHRTRADSFIEPLPEVKMAPQSYDCDLSVERDVLELIDAVKKLLRYTDIGIQDQRSLVSDLKSALSRIIPGEISTMDKSLVVSAILRQTDQLTLPDDLPSILPTVYKIIAVVNL